MTKVEHALKDAADKCKSLEEKSKAQATTLPRPLKRLRRRGPNPELHARRLNKPRK